MGVRVADLHPQAGKNIIRDFRTFDAGNTIPSHELEIQGRIYLISVSPIHDAEGKVIAITVAHSDITEKKAADRRLKLLNDRLRKMSSVDHLTQVLNRRSFDKALVTSASGFLRHDSGFGLIMFDIDRFKDYNDRYGHPAGDRCLASVAQCVRRVVRDGRRNLFRYGGEEFAALVPGADIGTVRHVAERIRRSIEALDIPIPGVGVTKVTVSAGVAFASSFDAEKALSDGRGLSAKEQSAKELSAKDLGALIVTGADEALYRAKENGRNQVMSYPAPVLARAAG